MDASLAECLKSIAEIRHQLQTIELEAELFRELPGKPFESELEKKIEILIEHLSSHTSVKRQFDYRSMIVSIYGTFEQFLDGLIAEYVQAVNHIVPAFRDLPEAISNNHLEASLDLIARVSQRNYRGSDSVKSIVSCLHSCLNETNEFILNSTAFSNRRANYRPEVIVSSFAKLGITNILRDIRQLDTFNQGVSHLFPDREIERIDEATMFQLLDELAERRNDIAHGYVTEFLAHDLLTPYIDIVEATVRSMHEAAFNALCPLYVKFLRKTMLKPIAVFDHKIVCLTIDGFRVESGDLLIGWNEAKNRYFGGLIGSIEVEKQSVEFVDGTNGAIATGLSVPFHANDNQLFCVVAKAELA